MTTSSISEAARLQGWLKRFRTDPVLYVQKVFGVDPTKHQKELLNAVAVPGAHVSARSGHGTGKSTALAWLILWKVPLFKDCKVPCTAPTAPQLRDVLWAEIAKWHGRMMPWFKNQIEISSDRVFMKSAPNTQFAVARTARQENPDALQGFHADNLLFIIDEASGVPEKVFEVAEGALSTPSANVVMTGNPTRVTGYFHASHHKFRNQWKRLHFSCLDSPLVDQGYPKNMAEKYGTDSDIYRVRVQGDFPNASSCQLIGMDLVEAASARKVRDEQFSFAPKVLGVDVAWEGDDRSCVYLRQGLMCKRLGVWHKIDNMTLASMVMQYEDQHSTDATFIDVGWGTGVIDRLRQLGRSPVPVNFGSKALSDRYYNRRTEMWCLMRDWLEDGGVLPHGNESDDLRADMVGPEYGFSPSMNRIALESKKDMKKRGLPSPDEADALALTFASPVRPKYNARDARRANAESVVFANNKYDLFARR